MQSNSPSKNRIEVTVTIRRPVEQVFGFYRDFKNLLTFLGDVMAIEPTGPANFSMDDRRSFRHSKALDDRSDRGACERANSLRNGYVPHYQNILGNIFRSGTRARRDGGSQSDESTRRRTCASCSGADWKISRPGSLSKSTPIQASHRDGESDRHNLCCPE